MPKFKVQIGEKGFKVMNRNLTITHRSLAIQRLAVAIYEAVFDVERPILSKLFQKALALRMLVVPVK